MEILFEERVKSAAPELTVLFVEADVVNGPTDDDLWAEIERASEYIRSKYAMDQIRHRPAIDATRAMYKACGKDPNRYRPSAESLCRRAVKGLDLYRTDSVVDLINLISMVSGHSIGGFDAGKIDGDALTLGVGEVGEPYEAIGRGSLNIAGLPVFRDAAGGIGTPTSDNERTKLSADTRRLVMTINMYGAGDIDADEVHAMTERLLRTYAKADNITFKMIRATAL